MVNYSSNYLNTKMAIALALTDRRLLDEENIIGDARFTRDTETNKEESGRFTYDEIIQENAAQSCYILLICFLISVLITVALVNVARIPLCHVAAIFLSIFLICMLTLGTRYMKNLAFFAIFGIILVAIVTIFAYVIYSLLRCHD